MKRIETAVRIDLDAEIAAMVAYIEPRFDNLSNPAALFRRIHASVVADGPLWFDEHPLFEAIRVRINRRQTLLSVDGAAEDAVRRYDASTAWMTNMPMVLKRIHEASRGLASEYDFSKRAPSAHYAAVREFPDLATVLPKGWALALEHYREHEGMHDYAVNSQLKDEDEFQGFDTSGHGAGGFTMRTALTSLMYDDREQNRRPAYGFVSAIYAHFAAVHEHNNTVDLVAAFEQLDLGDLAPAIEYDLPVECPSGHPLLDTLLEHARVRCMSAESLREMRFAVESAEKKRAAMTPAELAAEEQETRARMRVLVQQLVSKRPDAESVKRLREEDDAIVASLRTRAKAAGIAID